MIRDFLDFIVKYIFAIIILTLLYHIYGFKMPDWAHIIMVIILAISSVRGIND